MRRIRESRRQGVAIGVCTPVWVADGQQSGQGAACAGGQLARPADDAQVQLL